MRSAAKHVMSSGKVLPVHQTKEKLNKFQAASKRKSIIVYFFCMVTHEESPLAEY